MGMFLSAGSALVATERLGPTTSGPRQHSGAMTALEFCRLVQWCWFGTKVCKKSKSEPSAEDRHAPILPGRFSWTIQRLL